jgi:hypothetical protein
MSLIKFVLARLRIQDFQDNYFPSEKLLADFPVSVDSLRVPADWKAPSAHDLSSGTASVDSLCPHSLTNRS